MTQHINGYALALFELAQEEKKLKQYKDQAEVIITALEDNEDYVSLLDNKSLDSSDRQELVKKAFAKKINKNLLNLMFILVERSKATVAVPALKKLIKFINVSLKINEGTVYSISPLEKSEVTKISTKISKMLGKKITLINKIDAELVSGVRVVVGDEVIEDSMQSRLEQIKTELLEREAN